MRLRGARDDLELVGVACLHGLLSLVLTLQFYLISLWRMPPVLCKLKFFSEKRRPCRYIQGGQKGAYPGEYMKNSFFLFF